ncbi:MAG: hypothetical protein OQJ77_07925 [Thiovulaceae bacterium]|nr:hypothetical protein [Sulfurimonadaceae bacterium]
MKSILLILLFTLISLKANTMDVAKTREIPQFTNNGLEYSIKVSEHFEPFVYLNNKLQDMKINFKGLDFLDFGVGIGASGDISKSFSYFFKYSSSTQVYDELKHYYEYFRTLKQDNVETSSIYAGLNIRF